MEYAVSVKKLSKRYGDFLALDGVELDVEAGELFALLGPNGAGKTTLMRILTTQLEPSAGEAFVLGKNVVSQGADVRRLVSYVPQEMSVWTDISGYENLLIYSKIYGVASSDRKKLIEDALALMDLEGVENHLVSTYSGGMIRKLELACATMINPGMLFLDEPTIGLDPSTRKTVWERLKTLNRERGINVFFSTHYMDEAGTYADKIGIINQGKIVTVASPEDLKRSVGDDSIEIETDSPLSKRALDDLRALDGISRAETEGNTLRVMARDSALSLNAIISVLISDKVNVHKVNASKPTIDDAFLKYAGTKDMEGGQRGSIAELKGTRRRITRG
jgi:ABC-2 type transport system ATP-binding protein